MSHRFSEHTINGVTYRVEQELTTGDWIVVGYWKVNGEKQHVSSKVYSGDVQYELDANGLDGSYTNREHAALRIGVLRCEPVVEARNERLLELEHEQLYDPMDPDMDEHLADALRYGAPDWLKRERQLEEQAVRQRKAEIAEKARQQAEKDRIERERREADTAAMESSEVFGLF